MKLAGIVPVKRESKRCPLKNFRVISDVNGPPAWKVAYTYLREDQDVGPIWFSLDSAATELDIRQELDRVVQGTPAWQPYGVLWEGQDFPQGKSLGGTLAAALGFLEASGKLQGVDYVAVPQCDHLPKLLTDLDRLKAFAAANPSIGYIVSADRGGRQTGAWRLIKVPLAPEIFGQTVGFVRLDLEDARVDIHTEDDLERLRTWYLNYKHTSARVGPQEWWLI